MALGLVLFENFTDGICLGLFVFAVLPDIQDVLRQIREEKPSDLNRGKEIPVALGGRREFGLWTLWCLQCFPFCSKRLRSFRTQKHLDLF